MTEAARLHPQLKVVLYHEFWEQFAAHLLSLAPAEIAPEARHEGETWNFYGRFPAVDVVESGYPHVPTERHWNQLPGQVDARVEFFFPSVGTLADPDGTKHAEKVCRRLHSLWRAALYAPGSTAFSMDGRVDRIEIISADAGDRDRFGNVRRIDTDTQNILWMHGCNVRCYL